MKLHSILLREECSLPDRLDPLRKRVCDGWTLVEEIPAMLFDTMVRRFGWHFMWLHSSISGRGFGTTHGEAANRALIRALGGIPKRFNAAELDADQVRKYLGFYIAKITVQPRHVQEGASLETAQRDPLAIPSR